MRLLLTTCLVATVFKVGQSFHSNLSKSKTSAVSMSTVTMPVKPMNSFWNRLMFSIGLNKRVRTDEELKRGIANFYDESSQVWLDVWVSFPAITWSDQMNAAAEAPLLPAAQCRFANNDIRSLLLKMTCLRELLCHFWFTHRLERQKSIRSASFSA